MQVILTVQEKLKDLRVERRLTLEQLAEETGISKSALGKYETDDYKDMSPFNLLTLAKYYGVSTDYLLGLTQIKNHPNTELHSLHLSDDMVDLLRSGKINNRLLCEMSLHPNFQRLMVDIEIFVDRIVDMRIHDMNAVLDATRKQLMAQHDPGENDLYVRTVELAQVQEDDFFAHVIHKDMDTIIRSIRDAHKKDRMTADVESTSDKVKKNLEEAMHFEGSEEEKKVRVFLAALGIDYDKLTREEFVLLMGVLKKSEHLKSPYSQRGKSGTHQNYGKRKRQ